MVVELMVWPASSSVDGKLGWLGELVQGEGALGNAVAVPADGLAEVGTAVGRHRRPTVSHQQVITGPRAGRLLCAVFCAARGLVANVVTASPGGPSR
jgi:hypothetical protein